MPNIDWNRETWDKQHDWSGDGDEWSGMAEHCGQPYEAWKQSLVEEFLLPHVHPDARVLEVAPGHGRFTEYIVGMAASTVLVDLSPTCLEICRDRFGDDSTTYVLTEGTSLPGVEDASVDFIWSFDSFVHMELEVIDAYLSEFHRVLRPDGKFTIHHAGKRDWSLKALPLTKRMGRPGRVVQRMISQHRLHDSGRRADVSREGVVRLVEQNGLSVLSQCHSWGTSGEYDVAKYGDWITTGMQPS